MLSKRANIMFQQHVWNYLAALAKKRKTTIGILVRDAVSKTYHFSMEQQEKFAAHRAILRLRTLGNKLDYKALIEEGRTR